MDCKATPPFETSLKGGTGKLGKRAGLYLGGGQGLRWGESLASDLESSSNITTCSTTNTFGEVGKG